MMPVSVETLVPSGPRNRVQSLPPSWAPRVEGTRSMRNRPKRANGAAAAIPSLVRPANRDKWHMISEALIFLDLGDFFDAAGMAAPFEFRFQPYADHAID